ncbi:50S ribosomal protein L7/L12 [Bienertia sinuspersici]
MSLILRFRQHVPIRLLPKPYISSIITSKTQIPRLIHRSYGQPALQEEDIEVEIDPRRLPADYDPSKFDPTAHRSPPNDRVLRLVDEVSSLKLTEVAELGSILMEKMGMKEDEPPVIGVLNPCAAAGLAQMAGKSPAGDAQESVKEEKTVFELKLESFETASKLKVIKEIRALTDLGLKEAKDLVEKTPSIFKKGVPKEEAEQIIDKLKAAGAKVVME